ncbi:LPXTG cell wall anchor domain-containing protein [Dysgonomonadaceae bacterium zrk40]|nr:LPXTG cell wall anchor domain-containing protein [Dysgonomonadaceae bacterium zrk40]
MKRRLEKQLLLPLVLVCYALIMGVLAYPRYRTSGNWGEYFTIIGITLLLALLLYFLLKRRENIRNRFKGEE